MTRSLCASAVSKGMIALLMAMAVAFGMCALSPHSAEAATNQAATKAINNIKTQQYYKPGGKCPNGKNVGWLINGSWNCKAECYAFARGVAMKMYGSHSFISGVMRYGYKATSAGSYNCLGTLIDTPKASPSLSSVKSLMQKASPGDVIQFKGGPKSYSGTAQHTAIVEAVDGGGIRIYQHGDKPHVTSTYYNWSSFYNSYLDFDAYTARYNKGISLYHFKNYASKFPTHTHNYSKVSYGWWSMKWNQHSVTKVCSCGASGNSQTENCSFTTKTVNGVLKNVCSKCGRIAHYGDSALANVKDGCYMIFPAKDRSFAVDVYNGSKQSKGVINIWKSNNSAAQHFTFERLWSGAYKIKNAGSGMVVSAADANLKGSSTIWQEPWSDQKSETWFIEMNGDGTYSFRNWWSNLYMDVANGAYKNGTRLIQYPGNNGINQHFILVPCGSDANKGPSYFEPNTSYYYEIKNVKSGKYLNIVGNKNANNANVDIYARDYTIGEAFKFTKSNAGGYYFCPKCATGRAVNIYGNAAANNLNVCLWSITNHSTQAWVMESVSGGYVFRSVDNQNYVLTATGTGNSSNVNIQSYRAGDTAQIWTISKSTKF